MTAPFAPPPPKPALLVVFLMIAVAAAIPFARREDWIGWLAFLTIAAGAIAVWALLLWGFSRAIAEWWRERRRDRRP